METRRLPWVGALLNWVCPGLGFVYLGRIHWALATLAAGPVLLLLAGRSGVLFFPSGFGLVTLLYIAGWVAIGIAAYRVAIKHAVDNSLVWQRWYLYPAFILLSFIVMGAVSSVRASLFGYDLFNVPAASMAPTLIVGDKFIADTQAFSHRQPQRGEVVVFRNPVQPEVKFVKRVIGLPGETIEISKGVVKVDQQTLREPYVAPRSNPFEVARPAQWRVPENSYFLLGDERDHSFDSRHFGAVPADFLVGSARFIWFSADEQGIRWERVGRRIQ